MTWGACERIMAAKHSDVHAQVSHGPALVSRSALRRGCGRDRTTQHSPARASQLVRTMLRSHPAGAAHEVLSKAAHRCVRARQRAQAPGDQPKA